MVEIARHLDRSYSAVCTVLNKKVRERVERSYGFSHYPAFGMGVHGSSTHISFFQWIPLGEVHFACTCTVLASILCPDNTLKGTGERKPPPNRVGLSTMDNRLFASAVCRHRERLTSMGRPHCGLPPVHATRFAQTSATANAIIHSALPTGTGPL